MRKLISLLLVLTLIVSLSACSLKSSKQDESPVTMMVALGNSESYYRALADKIETELGIDVEFVYQINADTTDYVRLCFANNEPPADIVFTASKTDDALLKDSCVDLLSQSSVTALFTPMTVRSCTTEDGAVYQLPVCTKLIGITYNETLLNEMGWEVPESFDDMLKLKEKCDDAGIKFAVCDGAATGHGFNWLFHLMGSQWLSTFDGTEWFEDYQAGTCSVDEFKKQCNYFKKWTEAGLWGSIHNSDWSGNVEFMQTRALFWYGLTNTVSEYNGPEYDDNGNETGRELHDTYKTMPWISEDGSNNCFTCYDSCWITVNKALEAPEKSEKLAKVLKIVEYLTTGEATQLVSEMSKDTYVAVNNFEMGEDRLYADYSESVCTGFIQPWYYNSFDTDSIVFTGEKINNYIAGSGSFDEIFETLDECNQNHLNSEIKVLADFPEGLGLEDTAKLAAIGYATALDMTLEENGRSERAEVALVPYTPEENMLQPWKPAFTSNTKVFKGKFDASMTLAMIPQSCNNTVGIYMTGAEIKALVEKKYDPSDRYIDANTGQSTFDSENYGPYPYVCLVKGGAELVDTREYLVALCGSFITREAYTAFSDAGKIITDLSGAYGATDGIIKFAESHPQITAEELVW